MSYSKKLCRSSSPIITQSCKHGKADRTHTNTLNNKPQKATERRPSLPLRGGIVSERGQQVKIRAQIHDFLLYCYSSKFRNVAFLGLLQLYHL